MTDIAALAAALTLALRAAGLPVGPDRGERLALALTVLGATTIGELHACALVTMVSGPNQVEVFERVFDRLFGAGGLGAATAYPDSVRASESDDADPGGAVSDDLPSDLGGLLNEAMPLRDRPGSEADQDAEPADGTPAVRRIASGTERLRERDFGQVSETELARLAALMRDLVIAVPPRRTRRYRARKDGARIDMRRTMRQATRTGGEPVRIARRAVRSRPRRLVVLCDISGSMEPYARAILQLVYVATQADLGARPRTEVFTFATRLTRLTPYLAAATPATMLAKAAEAAPDWAGGTRIGEALRAFNDGYGARGLARGAVVLVISDGWETGDPRLLGAQLARLHRLAYRIVWANPRTQSPRYRPEVGGMAAAWPYCDAVVSAHNFDALDDLLAALASR